MRQDRGILHDCMLLYLDFDRLRRLCRAGHWFGPMEEMFGNGWYGLSEESARCTMSSFLAEHEEAWCMTVATVCLREIRVRLRLRDQCFQKSWRAWLPLAGRTPGCEASLCNLPPFQIEGYQNTSISC